MSNVFLYNRPLTGSMADFARGISAKKEDEDLHATDISTFTNNHFVFYVPPPTNRIKDCRTPNQWDGFGYKYREYNMANLSSIEIFAYENGAEVNVEWLNCSVISGAEFDRDNWEWTVEDTATIIWAENIDGPKSLKKKFELDNFDNKHLQLTNWMVSDEHRIISGVVRITSDNPISVMHHKLYDKQVRDEYRDDLVWYDWNGVYSAYGKKLYTRITGDCWISALEANTEVRVWDRSDNNDDMTLELDRFEGWDYSRNAIFDQVGFDNDLVLISASKPVSIVAGVQSDQAFVQVFGKDGRDYLFPCFGYVLIHALSDTNIELEDRNGNQGSFKGSMKGGEMRIFDFRVSYKQRYYSSFEWAHLRSSEPILVYTFINSSWYLNENYNGLISGEEYVTKYKKITEFYTHGVVPYPADTDFKLPLRSRATVTVVNLDTSSNNIEVDFEKLYIPFKGKMNAYESITFDFSDRSYYPMDLFNDDTRNYEKSSWLYSDPNNWYALDRSPHISAHEERYNVIEEKMQKWLQKVSWENITKGSIVSIKAESPVLVLINYDKDEPRTPQGVDLIPGLTPPIMRGLPDFPTWVVIISGIIIAVDMVVVAAGRKSIVELF